MGRTLQLITVVGVVILAALVVMAIMSLAGSFDPQYTNPPT